MRTRIAEFVRPDLADLKPYVVKNVPHRIKMDANENPFEMPGNLRQLIADEVLRQEFNRYPDPASVNLRMALAEELGVEAEQLVIGNGSDELINYTIALFGGYGSRVIFPTPTFSMYGILAKVWGAKAIGIYLSDDFDIMPDEILSSIQKGGRNIIFISYPNNPTGNCFSRDAVMEIVGNSGAIVVIDEAYYEFSGKTFLPILDNYKNMIILRTFSKAYGLAGLRVGYMIASREIISEITKVKLVYNINSLSQRLALVLLKHKDEVKPYLDMILKERDHLTRELNAMNGITPFHSDANFILFRAEPDAEVIFSNLLDNGILIRNLNEPGLLHNCLRVTVGKPDENITFVSTLKTKPG